MKEKKQSKNWYIALTYYLTAGFVPPLLVFILLGFLMPLIRNEWLFVFIQSLAFITSIYLGVLYGTSFINKAYVIKNKNAVLKLASIYFFIFSAGSMILNINKFNIFTGIYVLAIIISIILFFLLSKRYIKSDISE